MKTVSLMKITHTAFTVSSYLFLYLPIFIVIVFSFNTGRFPARWDHFTLRWYKELFLEKELWLAFSNSLIVALSATVLSLAMGVLFIFYRFQSGRGEKALNLFYGNLVIPEMMLAVSLLIYFTLLDFSLGMATLVVAHSVFALGFVVPILYTRYTHIDPRLCEASLTLGASMRQTFFKVILPLLKPTLLATGLLVFILSFDDFELSYFCAGTKIETLSLHLLSMLRLGITPVINALSTLIFIASSAFILCFLLPTFYKRSRHVR